MPTAEPSAAPHSSRGDLLGVVDPDDLRLAEFRQLNDPAHRRRVEKDQSIFVVEGRISVRQLLESSYQIRSLFVDDHQASAAADLVEAVRAAGAPVYVAPRQVMAATAGFDLHRGLVAVAERPTPSDPDQIVTEAVLTPSASGGPPLVAVLEGVNDSENIGATFRNAAAFGVGAVLLDPTSGDPLYRRSVRVSVGHVLHVPFARLTPWPDALDGLRAAGFLVAALAPAWRAGDGPPSLSVSDLAARRPAAVALLLGAEGPGLSDGALEAADLVVSIPMAPGVDSLNVATAAAIAFQMLSHPGADGRPDHS